MNKLFVEVEVCFGQSFLENNGKINNGIDTAVCQCSE